MRDLLGDAATFERARRRLEGARAGSVDADAYVHPYGFVVIRLGDLRPGWGLRLHIWPPSYRVPDATREWTVHDHGWDLYSHVVAGTIRHDTYEVAPLRGGGASMFVVEASSYVVGHSRLRRSPARFSCRLADTHVVGPGETYRVAPLRFHTSMPGDDGVAATLVLTEAARGRRSRVISREHDGHDRVQFARQRVDWAGLRPAVRDVAQRLGSLAERASIACAA